MSGIDFSLIFLFIGIGLIIYIGVDLALLEPARYKPPVKTVDPTPYEPREEALLKALKEKWQDVPAEVH